MTTDRILKSENILIVAHDSGGAAILASWVERNSQNFYEFCLEGPAVKFFERKRPGFRNESRRIFSDLKSFDRVVTGTGWESDLEKKAIRASKLCGIPTVSFLDHWTNYLERFRLEGEMVLPEEIWVGDEYALSRAREFFPETSISLKPNPYWLEMLEVIEGRSKDRNPSSRLRVLYVTEPTSLAAEKSTGNALGYGYTEFQALENYLELISLSAERFEEIRIRLHPRESKGKYDDILQRFKNKVRVSLSENADLAVDCAWSDWVVGCDSMAMVIGILAKREVFCAIPKGGKHSALPFKEIQYIFR